MRSRVFITGITPFSTAIVAAKNAHAFQKYFLSDSLVYMGLGLGFIYIYTYMADATGRRRKVQVWGLGII